MPKLFIARLDRDDLGSLLFHEETEVTTRWSNLEHASVGETNIAQVLRFASANIPKPVERPPPRHVDGVIEQTLIRIGHDARFSKQRVRHRFLLLVVKCAELRMRDYNGKYINSKVWCRDQSDPILSATDDDGTFTNCRLNRASNVWNSAELVPDRSDSN